MKIFLAGCAIVMVAACVPVPPLTSRGQVAAPQTERGNIGATPAPQPRAAAAPSTAPRFSQREISGITFEGVAFDSRVAKLSVVDQAGGPGSEFPDAANAGQAAGGIVAVNASFFTPQGTPLGLVVAGGYLRGQWNNASSLGSGVWYQAASGKSAIVRREKLGKATAGQMQELIQAGPMLVENARAITGLDATKTSARIAILWNGDSQWWIGRSSPCTLAAFAQALTNGNPAGWRTVSALNLDGGRSADLWVSAAIPGGPISRRSPWNRPVRNFLILKKL